MATTEYSELDGNAVLLKAAEYLRMLPEWKAKPGKLRSGFVEFGELIARHLVNHYCELEGKPLAEKIEIDQITNPLALEMEALASSREQAREFEAHTRQLNDWHCQLAVLESAMGRVVDQLADAADDEPLGSIGDVLKRRFHDLIESCPFPRVGVVSPHG